MDYHIDGTKLAYHPERVAQWLSSKDDWEKAKTLYPLYVEIAPIGACNHRCTFCSVDFIGYKAVRQDKTRLSEILLEMGGLGVKSVMFAGEGEPLLHKDIDEMVCFAKAARMDVSFTTNGVLLDKLETLKNCTWVKVSLNAGKKETYAKIHQTNEKDWDTVWRNLEEGAKRKGDCTLGVQSVLLPDNSAEMVDLAKRCRDSGVDYLVIKPYTQSKYGESRIYEGLTYENTSMDEVQKLSTPNFTVIAREKSMAQANKPISYDKCQATPYLWAYVMADGNVYSCGAYLLDQRFHLGNINEKDFKQIWHGEKRKRNWEFVRKELDISECRKNCRMNASNIFLNSFGKIPHQNFI